MTPLIILAAIILGIFYLIICEISKIINLTKQKPRQEANDLREGLEHAREELSNTQEEYRRVRLRMAELEKSLFESKQSVKDRNIKINNLKENIIDLQSELTELSGYKEALDAMQSNLTAFPYMAGIVADIETFGLEKLAYKLNWGTDQRRLKKVKTIREIRKDARLMVEKNKKHNINCHIY